MTDLRRSKQDNPDLQQAVNKRKKIVNQTLSDIKQGRIPKEKIIPRKKANKE